MKKVHYITIAVVVAAVALSAFTKRNIPAEGKKATTVESIAKAEDTWKLDRAHSNIGFNVTHMVVSETTGKFRKFEGSMTATKADFTDAAIEFTIDVNSIDTEEDARDKHLKSDDFFNAEKYPNIKFKSKSFKKGTGNKYTLTGDLTIRDITKTVTWDVVYNGTQKDPWGGTKAGFKATTKVNRFDYGLKWNTVTEAGGAVVGKDVTINVNVEFSK